MSESVYRKTPLPVRLNLNDRNTREQLSGPAPEDNARGALEGVGVASLAQQSQKDSIEVMRKDLCSWLCKHGIDGPPPSPEAEQRAMWQWIRDFHKEYNDDWFARNMPRMLERFRPVFMDEMKRMKAERSATESTSAKDLLDFDQAKAAPGGDAESAQGVGNGSSDLLSLDAGVAQTQAAAYSAEASVAPMPTAATAPAGGGLLDLSMDIGTSASAPAKAPATPPAPSAACPPSAPASQEAGAGKGDGLLDLLF